MYIDFTVNFWAAIPVDEPSYYEYLGPEEFRKSFEKKREELIEMIETAKQKAEYTEQDNAEGEYELCYPVWRPTTSCCLLRCNLVQ